MLAHAPMRLCAPGTRALGVRTGDLVGPKSQNCRRPVVSSIKGYKQVGIRGARREFRVCRVRQDRQGAPTEAPALTDSQPSEEDADSVGNGTGPSASPKPSKQTYVPPTLLDIAKEEFEIIFRTSSASASMPADGKSTHHTCFSTTWAEE